MKPTATNHSVRHDVTRWTEDDLQRFKAGKLLELWKKLGAHPMTVNKVAGVYFGVWAPQASAVSVVGDFNRWDRQHHPLAVREPSGIWEGWIPGIPQGSAYKFQISSGATERDVDKADPLGLFHQVSPETASIVWDLDYRWGDGEWMRGRGEKNRLSAPMTVYEVHLGSWRRLPGENNRPLNYRELAVELVEHVRRLGFTHVEFLPVMEHPFFPSWGYQTTGYFAPSSRYGTPQDFKFLIDSLHQHGIGVILDWVPSHFPSDEHGLALFDGTPLYEHADPRRGFHPDWNSCIFDYGRPEVCSFLTSSAMFWLDEYHADALRVDAVASMLYLDYSRKPGEWVPNQHGGREHLEAIDFLRNLNTEVYRRHPEVLTIAEESTAWPQVSRPIGSGGLGFGMKWDMGWMHDTLKYLGYYPHDRKHHHHELTFRMVYAFNENFIMPLSHDEVVRGTGSLLDKMPGDDWQKFANVRLLYGYMYGMPGKKLLFMGAEFAQRDEWNHDACLEWELLEHPQHRAVLRWLATLNEVYRREAALHELDCDPAGFEWIDANDAGNSVFSFVRKARSGGDLVAVVLNFTPTPLENYRIGVPRGGRWRELLSSDAQEYGGSGYRTVREVDASSSGYHGRPCSLQLTLPPLGVLFLKSGDPARSAASRADSNPS